MAEIKITDSNFEAEVLHSDQPVLLDFWATWCGPCQMLAPLLEELAEEYEGRAKIGKVNVDEEPNLAAKFHIVSIPTLVLIKDGKIADTKVGYRPKEELAAMLG